MLPSRRRASALLGVAATVVATLAVTASPAHADGPTTFSNTTRIDVPAVGSADQTGVANPYPSPITVVGMTGPVTDVQVALNNFTSDSAADVDVLVVAPNGDNLVLMSDIGEGGLKLATNATLTFSDSGGSFPAGINIPTGTYKPTDTDLGGAADPFPAPAPAPSTDTTLAAAFTGTTANGQWRLFAVDDVTGDVSFFNGGWSLTLTTQTAAASTSTSVISAPNPSLTGNVVTYTATVTSGGSPVTSGSVTFTSGATNLGTFPLNGSGQAAATSSALGEGTHVVTATYGGAAGFLGSNGTTTQVVDRPTTVQNGRRFCNTGGITLPDSGQAAPYASRITVSGVDGTLNSVRPSIEGLTHTFAGDLDVLLVAPGGQNIVLMSDAGAGPAVTNAKLAFEDGSPSVPGPLPSGSTGLYQPTNYDDGIADTFPAPAPAPSSSTSLADLNVSSPNGVWSLYVVDDASGDAGSISTWCVRISATRNTATALTVEPTSGASGSSRDLTATVTSGGSPVTLGNVKFFDTTGGVRSLLDTVAVNGNGQAVLTTTSLDVGSHQVKAVYQGARDGADKLLPSQSPGVRTTVLPVAEANGPYVISEGQDLVLSAAGSVPADATYSWDLNKDGDFSDASGSGPTVTWAQLQTLGVTPGRVYTIRLRVARNGYLAKDSTTLTIAQDQ